MHLRSIKIVQYCTIPPAQPSDSPVQPADGGSALPANHPRMDLPYLPTIQGWICPTCQPSKDGSALAANHPRVVLPNPSNHPRMDLPYLPNMLGWICPTCSERLHRDWRVGHGVGVPRGLHVLGLAPRPILIVGMVRHVLGPNPLGLVDEGTLLRLRQQLPLGTQALRNFGVVHLGVLLGDLPPLHPRPHHEGVHRPLDVLAPA